MRSTIFLILTLMAQFGLGASMKFTGNASTDYIFAYEDFRNTNLAFEKSLVNYKIEVENAKKEAVIHQMNEQLFDRKAISEDEFQHSLLKKNVSEARVPLLQNQTEFFRTLREKNRILMEVASGKDHTVEEIYAVYLRHWNAQCEDFKAQVHEAEAQYALAEYLLKVARILYEEKKAISKEEFLVKEQAYVAADQTLKTNQALSSACLTDVPSLERIKSFRYPSR